MGGKGDVNQNLSVAQTLYIILLVSHFWKLVCFDFFLDSKSAYLLEKSCALFWRHNKPFVLCYDKNYNEQYACHMSCYHGYQLTGAIISWHFLNLVNGFFGCMNEWESCM